MSEQQASTSAPSHASAPTVSLLVPIYNVERYLRACLESAASQTLVDIEIVCIDDGSTDGSRTIIEEFCARDSRFRLISKANSGYGDSMNRGLAMARGTYIGVLESDDIMLPSALEALVNAAERMDAQLAKGSFDFYWSKPDERRKRCELFPPVGCNKPVRPRDDASVFHLKPSIWSAIYRRDFLGEHAIRFLPTPGAGFQDTSFSFKAFACAERAVYVSDTIVLYRQDNEASSINSDAKISCVQGEYTEIERWLAEDFAPAYGYDEAARLLRIALSAKYDSYMWSYVRLAPRFRAAFLERMADEYRASLDAGEFSLDDLKLWKRANLEGILADPDAWERDNAAYASAGALGRAWHYLKLGGIPLLAAYAKSRLRHEV